MGTVSKFTPIPRVFNLKESRHAQENLVGDPDRQVPR